MKPKPTQEELLAAAEKILLFSRRRITQFAPALLESVYALKEKPYPEPIPICTDGTYLLFHPETVISDFRKDKDAPARQLLHVTLHCLLDHLQGYRIEKDSDAYDLATDLKVSEFMAAVSDRDFFNITDLHMHFPYLPQLTKILAENPPFAFYHRHAQNCRSDLHAFWKKTDQAETTKTGESAQGKPDWDTLRASLSSSLNGKLLEEAGALLAQVMAVADRGMSFQAFLQQFAAPQERMLLDPESFDPRWYQLGMEHFGNIPLLEPSEISEPLLPDDIVIALDTSGSCSGEVCKRFLKETLGILRDISAGTPRFHILLLQCDTEIQSEILLETPEQVETLFQNFQAKGFGGTDFRPVFTRIEELQKNGTLPRIRVLFYLSDGYGIFPDQPAAYPTIFLVPAEDSPRIPKWITHVTLNQNDYTVKEATK